LLFRIRPQQDLPRLHPLYIQLFVTRRDNPQKAGELPWRRGRRAPLKLNFRQGRGARR
jgi:hypothetical protein